MDEALRQLVVRRAANQCELCHLPQRGHDEKFSIDHVLAKKHGGDDSPDNLALSCLRCNLHKGLNLSGIDPNDGRVVRLFSPRRDIWDNHFRWNGPLVAGRTPVGRGTIAVLAMNASPRVSLRRALQLAGMMKPT